MSRSKLRVRDFVASSLVAVRRSWVDLLAITALTSAPPLALFAVLFGIMAIFLPETASTGQTKVDSAAAGILICLTILAAVIGLIAVGAVGTTAIQHRLAAALENRPMKFGDALKIGWHNWNRIMGLQLQISIVSALGTLLFIVPGVVYFLNRSMAPIIALEEGVSAKEAIARSRTYAPGRRLPMFLMWLAMYPVTLTMSLLIQVAPAPVAPVLAIFYAPLSFVLTLVMLAAPIVAYHHARAEERAAALPESSASI